MSQNTGKVKRFKRFQCPAPNRHLGLMQDSLKRKDLISTIYKRFKTICGIQQFSQILSETLYLKFTDGPGLLYSHVYICYSVHHNIISMAGQFTDSYLRFHHSFLFRHSNYTCKYLLRKFTRSIGSSEVFMLVSFQHCLLLHPL